MNIDTIKNFITKDNITNFTTCFISAVVGYSTCLLTINKPLYYKTLEKQLYDVYLPLFKLIEPNLFKEITLETAQEYISSFNNIKSNHYELIDSNLCNLFFIFENACNSNKFDYETYSYICSRLDFLFENTRKKLKLPRRKFSYKINKRQYPQKVIAFGYDIYIKIINFLLLLMLGLFFSIVFSFVSVLTGGIYKLFVS